MKDKVGLVSSIQIEEIYFILSEFCFNLLEFCLFTFSANFTIRVCLLRCVFSVFHTGFVRVNMFGVWKRAHQLTHESFGRRSAPYSGVSDELHRHLLPTLSPSQAVTGLSCNLGGGRHNTVCETFGTPHPRYVVAR